VIVHGKPSHEETRATFSHSAVHTPTLVIEDMAEAVELGKYLTGEYPLEKFYSQFADRYSQGFDAAQHLQKIGVVNQTTMLASDTQAIADYLKQCMMYQHGLNESSISARFADTRDTLCYATLDNQSAVTGLLETDADLAIVVGGRNSSNTSHLVELCEEKLTTYFVRSADDISSEKLILDFNWRTKQERIHENWLPSHRPLRILLTSGASCPDAQVEGVIHRLLELVENTWPFETVAGQWSSSLAD
jgi:4-hydroxy-3-methylbut-2-enyl diphosphate reductase